MIPISLALKPDSFKQCYSESLRNMLSGLDAEGWLKVLSHSFLNQKGIFDGNLKLAHERAQR
jgi:hypothetical protein